MDEITTQKELNERVKGAGAVCVLFHASWCPYCRAFVPTFEKKAPLSKIPFLKCRIDEEENPLWDECSINAVPTALLFKAGKVIARADAKPGVGLKEADLDALLKKA